MSHRISISTFALMFSMSLFSATVFAVTRANQDAFVLHTKDVRIRGTWPVLVTLNNNQPKIIQVIRVDLSKSATKTLSKRIKRILKNSVQKKPSKQYHALNGLPSKQYNGMNGMPVLDQGQWGTCATFAVTAAIDAVLSLADTGTAVSQLCNLELGVTLQNPYATDGGWSGSYASIVLDQISTYGYLDIDYQTQNGCGGLTVYPTNSANNGSGMPRADFKANSNLTFRNQNWWSLIPENTAPIDGSVLKNVKNTLVNGDDFLSLVVFSILLDPNINNAGVAGTYYANLDTWVLLPQILQDIYGGGPMFKHEMIIDGYNDNACASYQDGAGVSKQQCGLLHLRNSWGSAAGDNGDYYMSYDYFNAMVTEAYAIVTGGV